MKNIQIEYLHHINYDEETSRPRGGFTLAYYVSRPDRIGLQVAAAFCRPDETFNRKIGRNVAQALLTLGSPSVHRFYVRTLDLFPEALSRAVLVDHLRKDALDNALLRFVHRHADTFRGANALRDIPSDVRSRDAIVTTCFPNETGETVHGTAAYRNKFPRFLQGRIDLAKPNLEPNLLSEDFEEKFLAPARSLSSE